MTHDQYAKSLIENQGYEEAVRIVGEALKRCKHPSAAGLTLYDEADWSINSNGHHTYAKVQSEKKKKAKENRIKRNINFYYTVQNVLKKYAP